MWYVIAFFAGACLGALAMSVWFAWHYDFDHDREEA